ncbi:uncharacterized protein CEXT_689281 [Caerostris extrusa]|uniref:Uncharacterized protein n=1 Tax=Caerostris extrusa TaxID=172846 RepID=A0AAV4RRP1_CAEEX|nr:uncharacterized protein CEXT_689281 [Caerostris extrusa]
MGIKDFLKLFDQGKKTKRFVLQVALRQTCFVVTFIVSLKCLFQELWHRKIHSDGEIPVDLQKTWLQWCAEFPQLSKLLISRNVLECLNDAECKLEHHTFF